MCLTPKFIHSLSSCLVGNTFLLHLVSDTPIFDILFWAQIDASKFKNLPDFRNKDRRQLYSEYFQSWVQTFSEQFLRWLLSSFFFLMKLWNFSSNTIEKIEPCGSYSHFEMWWVYEKFQCARLGVKYIFIVPFQLLVFSFTLNLYHLQDQIPSASVFVV